MPEIPHFKQYNSILLRSSMQVQSIDSTSSTGTVTEESMSDFSSNPEFPLLGGVPAASCINVMQVPSQEILIKDNYKNHRLLNELQYDESGRLIMNPHNLKLLCLKQGLYEFPELNSKLYLHFKAFDKIQHLNSYTNVRTLYLQSNVIKKIQNLQRLVNLQNLFLHNNMIEQIENLNQNTELRVIDLSHNNIFIISGLEELRSLGNLALANNYLTDFESVQHLGRCSDTLTAIDLSSNQIAADLRLVDLIPQAKLLTLSNNPLVREIAHYRRAVIGRLKNLLYLDQRAINQEQRFISEKWLLGGSQAVKEARAELEDKKKKQKQEKSKEIMKDINVHRRKKINVFQESIKDLSEEIESIRALRKDPVNSGMWAYYDNSMAEKKSKIEELQGFVKGITQRISGESENEHSKALQVPQTNKQQTQTVDITQQKHCSETKQLSENLQETNLIQLSDKSHQALELTPFSKKKLHCLCNTEQLSELDKQEEAVNEGVSVYDSVPYLESSIGQNSDEFFLNDMELEVSQKFIDSGENQSQQIFSSIQPFDQSEAFQVRDQSQNLLEQTASVKNYSYDELD